MFCMPNSLAAQYMTMNEGIWKIISNLILMNAKYIVYTTVMVMKIVVMFYGFIGDVTLHKNKKNL